MPARHGPAFLRTLQTVSDPLRDELPRRKISRKSGGEGRREAVGTRDQLSNDQPVTPFASSSLQHQTAAARAHPLEKSVAAHALAVGCGPEMFFHGGSWVIIGEACQCVKRYIDASWQKKLAGTVSHLL